MGYANTVVVEATTSPNKTPLLSIIPIPLSVSLMWRMWMWTKWQM